MFPALERPRPESDPPPKYGPAGGRPRVAGPEFARVWLTPKVRRSLRRLIADGAAVAVAPC
jgi:hypothetical protein